MTFPLTIIINGKNKGTYKVKRVCDPSTYAMVDEMVGSYKWYIYGEDFGNEGATWHIATA